MPASELPPDPFEPESDEAFEALDPAGQAIVRELAAARTDLRALSGQPSFSALLRAIAVLPEGRARSVLAAAIADARRQNDPQWRSWMKGRPES